MTNFRNIAYFVLFLFCIFSVAIIGCGGDEDLSATEQLTGSYTLDAVLFEGEDGTVEGLKTNSNFAGELTLGASGQNASYTLTVIGETSSETGGTWTATSTTITFNWATGAEIWSYTFDGTDLVSTTPINGGTATMWWRKVE